MDLHLNLPEYPVKLAQREGERLIFDRVRKKYLKFSPEEWVRQNFIFHLIESLKVPESLIVIEKALKVNKLNRRTDILVYNRKGIASLIVECKAPNVKISRAAFEQIAVYNLAYKVGYLLVTNGIEHYACRIDIEMGSFDFLHELPTFEKLNL